MLNKSCQTFKGKSKKVRKINTQNKFILCMVKLCKDKCESVARCGTEAMKSCVTVIEQERPQTIIKSENKRISFYKMKKSTDASEGSSNLKILHASMQSINSTTEHIGLTFKFSTQWRTQKLTMIMLVAGQNIWEHRGDLGETAGYSFMLDLQRAVMSRNHSTPLPIGDAARGGRVIHRSTLDTTERDWRWCRRMQGLDL